LSAYLLVPLSTRAPPAILAQQRAAHAIQLVFNLNIAKVGPALIFGQAADQLVQQFLGALAPNMLADIRRHGEVNPPAGRIVEQQRGASRSLVAALWACRYIQAAIAQRLRQVGSLGRIHKRPGIGLEARAAGWAGQAKVITL
jgi:hypothetical protein